MHAKDLIVISPRTTDRGNASQASIQASAGLLPCAICIAAIHSIT
jgi:hypothetical protein